MSTGHKIPQRLNPSSGSTMKTKLPSAENSQLHTDTAWLSHKLTLQNSFAWNYPKFDTNGIR